MDDALPVCVEEQKRLFDARERPTLVKRGEADAGVSAGNTGALMADLALCTSRRCPVSTVPPSQSTLPSRSGRTYMLDLGANVDCGPEHLRQFAIMGSALASVPPSRRIGPVSALLNIGEEVIKGNDVVKQAAELTARKRPQLSRQRRG
jgi:glycerol-3-phosphate acyltransferase PlsX